MANCHVIFKSKTMKYVTIPQNGELSRNFSIGIKKRSTFWWIFFYWLKIAILTKPELSLNFVTPASGFLE